MGKDEDTVTRVLASYVEKQIEGLIQNHYKNNSERIKVIESFRGCMKDLVDEGIEQEKAKVEEEDLVNERIEQEKEKVEEKDLVDEQFEQEKSKVDEEDLVDKRIEQENAKVEEKDLVDERIEQEKPKVEEKDLVDERIEQEKAEVEEDEEDHDEVVVKKPEHLINKHRHQYTYKYSYANSSYTKMLNKPKYTMQDRHKASTLQASQTPEATTFEMPARTYKTYFQPREPSSNSVFQHQYVIEEVPAQRRSPSSPQNVAVPPPPPPTSRTRRFLSVIFCCFGKND